MPISSDLCLLPRLARRYAGFARQMLRDLEWHRRFNGPPFPPRTRRIVEQGRLLLRSAITGEDYYNHALYRESLSFDDKAAFLGYFEKSRYYNTLNAPVYDVLARDKALFQILTDSLGIPTPTTLATTAPGTKPAFGERLGTEAETRAFLAREGGEELFFKPADGSLGEGALSLGARLPGRRAWCRLPTGATIELEQVIAHLRSGSTLGRFLIQRRLRPHPLLGAIVPDVCPTIRLMTYTDARPALLGAALRLGSGDGPTDNLSGGGVVAAVDIESGRLGLAVNIDAGIPARTEAHPVTGARIAGVVVPGWREVLSLARDAASRLSFLPLLGWDIGITDEGPVVVEVNTRPRCRPIQISHDKGILDGPLRSALAKRSGVLDCGLIVAAGRG